MARPRRDFEGPSAQERLEEAFWKILEENRYSKITVASLCKEAGVNHNTFYYYFRDVEDMARKLFSRNMLPYLPKTILPLLLSGTVDLEYARSDPKFEENFRRSCLFAQSGSDLLIGILRDSMIDLWLNTTGVAMEQLTESEMDQLTFMVGGLFTAIGGMGESVSLERVATVMHSKLGKGILDTLSDIVKNHS